MRLRKVKIITISDSLTLSLGLELHMLALDSTLLYALEIFPALNFKIEEVNFCCFPTGKVIIMGIRRPTQINHVIYPTLVELEH